MKQQKSKRIISLYILSFTLPIVTALIGLLAGSYAPFGEKNILSAGAFSDQLRYFYEMYDRFKGGQGLGYSVLDGLGYDFTGKYFYFLSDPTNLIILLFPREALISVLTFLYLIKVGFAGLFFSMYFLYRRDNVRYILNKVIPTKKDDAKDNTDTEKAKKDNFVLGMKKESSITLIKYIQRFEWPILAFSVLYATSISIVTIGMNITYLSAIAIFPLVIMGLDKLRNTGNNIHLTITLILSFLFSIHMTIITLIFCLIYVLVSEYNNTKHLVDNLLKLIISTVIAVFSTSFIIINACAGGVFLEETNLTFPHIELFNPFNVFRQLISGNVIARTTFYGKGMDITIGIFLIFGVILFSFISSIKPVQRIKYLLTFVFLLGTICCNTTRYIFNGFSLHNEYTSIHYSYIIVFFAAILTFDCIHRIDSIKSSAVIITFVLSCAVIVSSIFLSEGHDSLNPFLASVEFLFGYFLITLIYSSKSMTKRLFIILVSILCLYEVIPAFAKNITAAGKSFESQRLLNVPDYITYETERYIQSIDPDSRTLVYNMSEATSTPFTNTILGYDYEIANQNTPDIDSLLELSGEYRVEEDAINYMNIYKNPYSTDGILLSDYIDDYEYAETAPFNSANTFVRNELSSEDIFHPVEYDIQGFPTSDDHIISINATFSNMAKGDKYLKAYYINHYGTGTDETKMYLQSVPVTLTDDYYYQGVTFISETFEKAYSVLSSRLCNTSKLSEIFSITNPGYPYLSLRYKNIRTLSFYVNDKKVTPTSVLDNNCVIPINNGNNTVLVKYNYIYVILGIFINIISLVLLTIYIQKKNKASRDKKIYKIYEAYSNKIADFISSNYTYITVIIICSIVFILSQMIAQCYPFGVYTTCKNDGQIQRYAGWVFVADTIKEGKILPFARFDIGGFFNSFYILFPDRILTPWKILKYLIIPKHLYLFIYTLEDYLYYVLSGLTFMFYLSHRKNHALKKSDSGLLLCGILYSLSAYSILFFTYSGGFRYMPYIPLIILGLEHLAYKKRGSLYISILFLQMIFEPYHAFIMCEFLILFFFTLDFDGIKDFFAKGVRFALYSVIAALLSAFYLIPYFIVLLSSSYTNSETNAGPSLFKWFSSYLNIITDYRTASPLGIISNDSSKSAVYCGVVVLFIIPLYVICSKIKKTDKIKTLIIVTLFLLAINNELFNYIFHGFHMQSLVPNRFAAFIVFFILCRMADIICYKVYIKERHLGIVVIVSSLIMLILYILRFNDYTITIKISIAILSAYALISLILIISKKELYKAMFSIAIADILINSLIVFPNNIGSKSTVINTANTISELAEFAPEIAKFDALTEYIDENTQTSNLGIITPINTVRSFYSAYSVESYAHDAFFNISAGKNIIYYLKGNPLADMMLHVKYHITNDFMVNSTSNYPEIKSFKNLTLHENPYYVSLGFVISGDASKEFNNKNKDVYIDDRHITKTYKNSFNYQNELCRSIGGENDLYEIIPLNDAVSSDGGSYYETDEIYEDVASNTITKKYLPLTFYLSDEYIGKKIYIDTYESMYYLGQIDSDNNTIHIDYPLPDDYNGEYTPVIAALNEETMSSLSETLSENKLENVTEDGKSIYATLDSDKSGMLFISLPYYDGWKAYVDGNEVKIEKYLGSMGIPIESGNHEIKLTYYPSGSMIGIIVSFITLFCVILFSIIRHCRMTIQKNTKKNEE